MGLSTNIKLFLIAAALGCGPWLFGLLLYYILKLFF